ncbi:MAG TPA: NAD(P)H-dependent oxidoreductase [Pseudonocardia sp.]|nr:NAD(P)H-dependent oxidoreductase [Pseudonocardia sp.]
MDDPVTVLLVTGSTRAASSNSAALRTAVAVAPAGVRTDLHLGLDELPAFNPDLDVEPLPPPVAELRARIAAADAVLFCAPEYAGALPGSFKNLLDWTVGGGEMYRKPVAWLTVAPEGRGEGAAAELAVVLGYLGTDVIRSACVRLTLAPGAVGADGAVADAAFRAGLADLLRTIQAHPRQAEDG